MVPFWSGVNTRATEPAGLSSDARGTRGRRPGLHGVSTGLKADQFRRFRVTQAEQKVAFGHANVAAGRTGEPSPDSKPDKLWQSLSVLFSEEDCGLSPLCTQQARVVGRNRSHAPPRMVLEKAPVPSCFLVIASHGSLPSNCHS